MYSSHPNPNPNFNSNHLNLPRKYSKYNNVDLIRRIIKPNPNPSYIIPNTTKRKCRFRSIPIDWIYKNGIYRPKAISFVNSTSITATAAGASLSTGALNCTTGNTLVAFARWASNGTTATVQDTAGNTYSAGTQTTYDAGVAFMNMWYCPNALGNAANVLQLNTGSSASFRGLTFVQYSGLALINILDIDEHSGQSLTGTAIASGTFTTTLANEVICAGFSTGGLETYTAGSGYTLREHAGGDFIGFEDKIVSSIQSGVTATATQSSGGFWAIYVMTFKQSVDSLDWNPKTKIIIEDQYGQFIDRVA